MVGASRLVITWEHADLCTALELPGEFFPPGVVVLDAARTGGHVLRWHPMRMYLAPPRPDGSVTITPQWGPQVEHRDVELPAPITEVLGYWRSHRREWRERELLATYAGLEQAGYRIRWVRRPAEEDPAATPAWRRQLAPVM